MRYLALACDYDETLATNGHVASHVIAALERLRATGRKLILVTGRRLEDLLAAFPRADLFDRIVAENGGVLFRPVASEEVPLATAPPSALVEALHSRGVAPLEVGRVVIATWRPHESTALEVIRDMGLDWQIIFNEGAVMLLPAGVNKATGLAAALAELDLSPHNVVGVGNSANDHSFLGVCECSVAVRNAIRAVREHADFATAKSTGDGVVQLIDELVDGDLAARDSTLLRHHLLLGTRDSGAEVFVPPYGSSLLVAGPSGSGKSTAATAFLERLMERGYQFCIIDPEGDYLNLHNAIVLGNGPAAPTVEKVITMLKAPDRNVVVNLLNVPLADRPSYFLTLLPRLQELRARTGRPHWIVIDEAHHLLPTSWQSADLVMSQLLEGLLLITVHPGHVAPTFLSQIDAVMAVGHAPEDTIGQFCEALGEKPPALVGPTGEAGEVLYWSRTPPNDTAWLRLIPSRIERRRHSRKYAEGEVPREGSFYFRGPDARLNLRAQNLILFMQLAEGVDDGTWMYHLKRGDYARWFRHIIKDKMLAAKASDIANDESVSAHHSRRMISEAIQEHYTLPI